MTSRVPSDASSHVWIKVWHVLATAAVVLLLIWWGRRWLAADDRQPWPNRPIEVVVPYPAGGGSDTFVRTLQKGFVEDDLLNQPLVVINIPGGGGTIGSRDVRDAKPNGYRILCHHDALLTAQLSGTVNYGPEAFQPVALTGSLTMVVIVRGDAPYAGLGDLMNAARDRPREITFGANQGAPAYFAALQLETCVAGAEFSVVSADGGADRYARILGGHLDAGIFSLSEYLDLRRSEDTPPEDNIRAIAVLSEQRHPAIPEVATSVEQDFPVLLQNANLWWAPRGTPARIVDQLATALQQAMQNSTVQSELKRLRIDPDFRQGAALNEYVQKKMNTLRKTVSVRQPSIPDFTFYVAGIVAALLAATLLTSKRPTAAAVRNDAATPPSTSSSKNKFTAAACFAALLAYVFVLSLPGVPFAIATAGMVLIVGGLMTDFGRQHRIVLLQLALLTGFGVDLLFSEVFVTPLP